MPNENVIPSECYERENLLPYFMKEIAPVGTKPRNNTSEYNTLKMDNPEIIYERKDDDI